VQRGRVTFPFVDDRGHVIAFTGPIAVPYTPTTSKYVNTGNRASPRHRRR
jgi:DNA primase catalytic core, N-terminal domain